MESRHEVGVGGEAFNGIVHQADVLLDLAHDLGAQCIQVIVSALIQVGHAGLVEVNGIGCRGQDRQERKDQDHFVYHFHADFLRMCHCVASL